MNSDAVVSTVSSESADNKMDIGNGQMDAVDAQVCFDDIIIESEVNMSEVVSVAESNDDDDIIIREAQ